LILDGCSFLWHIALMGRFMAKADYPGIMPAFCWTRAGTDFESGTLVCALEGPQGEWPKRHKQRLAASGKEEV
jgi:hypothetical protein